MRLRVSKNLIAALMVIFVAFIAGGGIYDLLDNPPSILPGPRGWISVHPVMNEQTLNESILSMFFTILSFVGLLIAYKSTQVSYDSKKANTMLILGIVLVLISVSGSYYIRILKRIAAQS